MKTPTAALRIVRNKDGAPGVHVSLVRFARSGRDADRKMWFRSIMCRLPDRMREET
ncbi:hypothetical protein CBM2598_U10017 [Cupriavidus taiwanensis]|uniref:Uncharacterized protein n=1 Tax=Cupriavidus taiwanensis TaxID=164546 RepID=A0A7Z7JHP2_9BURK|nr:hypothetical protein CBM2597_U10024 [Cupriavidus taiwanensis]SOZ96188.1 hypothetical protein CBM2598_U10017 [Cupriavidus taiwanensis]SPC25529.1 hypothetical protein CBM2594_U10030 [Cupriavidus taiwanensis]